jgi:integrase
VLRTKAPKTAAGTRLVELDPALLRALQDHRREQAAERLRAGARWVDHGLLFTTRYGTPLDNNTLRRRFRALLGEAGVPDPGGLRFHDLRYTGVSALIAAGVPVPEVAAIAGHATSAVTNQLYAHAVRRARGTALGEAAAFHQAQLDALGVPAAPDAVAESRLGEEDAADGAGGSAEQADTAERPGPEAP